PDRTLGLGLLFECLSQSNFPKDAFARERERLLSAIEEAERQPDSKAERVYREVAYGKDPYGRPSTGRRQEAEALTPADCQAVCRRVFVPNNTVVAVVGDFDSKQVIEEIKRFTADWKQAPVPAVQTPPVEKPSEFTQKIVTMADASQLHFYMGHAGIR